MDKELSFFTARIQNLVELSEKNQSIMYSNFLDENSQSIVIGMLRNNKVKYELFGGVNDTTRNMVAFIPRNYGNKKLEYPIANLKITYSKNTELSHKDVLGSLMSLSLKREMIGDIVIDNDNGFVYVFVVDNIKSFIISELKKIKNQWVSVNEEDEYTKEIVKEFLEIKGFISSKRIDVLASFICKSSRLKASEIIKSGLVFVNNILIKKNDALVDIGDIIVIRSYGKFLVKSVDITKKQRYCITLLKYV